MIVARGPVTYISSRPFPNPKPWLLLGEKSEGKVYELGDGFLGALNFIICTNE